MNLQMIKQCLCLGFLYQLARQDCRWKKMDAGLVYGFLAVGIVCFILEAFLNKVKVNRSMTITMSILFLSLQCDSALRNIVRIYPYDVSAGVDTTGDGQADEGSLRGSSEVVAERIRQEIQEKVGEAGLEIIEARITYLAYAPEIAAVMLQRQQASAIIDARKMIVDGAVGMVEMALERLNETQVVNLDEERKAAMVSNLLVVLCGNHDAQPVVNSGSLY